MSYEHKSNVNSRRSSPFLKILLAIIFILLVFYIFAPSFFPTIFTKIVSPFWKISTPTAEELQMEKNSIIFENALIDELRRENIALKEINNMHASTTVTLAYILKKPPFSAYDTFIIDIGKNKIVKLGEKVYAPGNILIGEVAEINESTAKVKLYSSYGEKFDVFLAVGTSTQNVQMVANGRGGGTFEIVIPRDMKVKIGDAVTVPSLTTGIFGIVQNIISDDAKTFSTVLFSQPINIYQLKWVELYQQ